MVILIFLFLISGAKADFSTFCVQNFNAYGPAYASSILSRTQVFSQQLKDEQCDLIHLQEAWMGLQINRITSVLEPDYHISAPNRSERVGLMSLFKGQGYT